MTNPYAPPGDKQSRPLPPSGSPTPTLRQPPPTPDPQAQKAAGRQVQIFALVMVAALIARGLPLPWRVIAFGLAAVALVLGIRTLRAVVRAGLRGFLLPAVGLSLALIALIGVEAISTFIWWEPFMEAQECTNTALTQAAQERCNATLLDEIASDNPLLNPSPKPTP